MTGGASIGVTAGVPLNTGGDTGKTWLKDTTHEAMETIKKYTNPVTRPIDEGVEYVYGWGAKFCLWKGLFWTLMSVKDLYEINEFGPMASLAGCGLMSDATKAYQYISHGCAAPTCAEGYIEATDCKKDIFHLGEKSSKLRQIPFKCTKPGTECTYTIQPGQNLADANSAGLKKCGGPVHWSKWSAVPMCGGVKGYEKAATAQQVPFGPTPNAPACQMVCKYPHAPRTRWGACSCSEDADCPSGYPKCASGSCHNPGMTCPLAGYCPNGWYLLSSDGTTSTCVAMAGAQHGKCSIKSEFQNGQSAEERQSWVDGCNEGIPASKHVKWTNKIPLCVGQRAGLPEPAIRYCAPFEPCSVIHSTPKKATTEAPDCGVGKYYADGKCQTIEWGGGLIK